MTRNSFLFAILFTFSIQAIAQDEALSLFDHVVGKTWKADGKWGDGSPFKQEVSFRYGLDHSIVIAESVGFIDQEQTKMGLRNHGIRQYDVNDKRVKFYEFDVFGGMTTGIVTQHDQDIIYQYEYGGTNVTDYWKYLNDSTYQFIVGQYEDGEWVQRYLTTIFHQVKRHDLSFIWARAQKELTGKWVSPAWDGELQEEWSVNHEGHLVQRAQYIEKGKILFESQNKMEIVGDDLILFTVIKDANPKIFRAVSWTEDEIIFENSDYKNPSEVFYSFKVDPGFHRTIKGEEGGKPSEYTFRFQKIKNEE